MRISDFGWKKLDSSLDWIYLGSFAIFLGGVIGMNYSLPMGLLAGFGFLLLNMGIVRAVKKLIARSRQSSVPQRTFSGAKE